MEWDDMASYDAEILAAEMAAEFEMVEELQEREEWENGAETSQTESA